MEFLWLIFWLALTLGIAYFNAATIGRWWTESKRIGGISRFLLWCGAIMAVCGFFMAIVTVMTLGMASTGAFVTLGKLAGVAIEPVMVEILVETIFDLVFLLVIFPILGSGLAIWAQSLVVAWHRRTVGSVAIAGWNTFAMARNTVTAARYLPKSAKSLGKNLKKLAQAGSGGVLIILMLLPIVISLGLAIFLTVTIARASDEKYQLADLPS